MIRPLLLALAVILTVLGCTTDPPAPVAVPEPLTPVHCDLIFPAPAPDRD